MTSPQKHLNNSKYFLETLWWSTWLHGTYLLLFWEQPRQCFLPPLLVWLFPQWDQKTKIKTKEETLSWDTVPLQLQKEWILSSTTIKLNTTAKQYRFYQLDKIKREYSPLLKTWRGLNFGSECKPWQIGWPSDLTSRSCLVSVLQEVCSISGKEIYISSLFSLWFLDFIKYS